MIRILIAVSSMALFDCHRKVANYEDSVTFVVYNSAGQGAITTFNRDLSSHGCDPHGNYAFIVHGWRENFATPWVNDMVTNLTVHRGGCTIFMDYSNYSSHPDYFRLVPHFSNLADLLQRKVEQVGSFDRMFMFGFSFGSRLCFEVGARLSQLGHQIDQIDACDPAGPAFDASRRAVDPKLAARNVACINTSITKGTSVYNCHQNFIMGRCGISQMGASRFPCGNHGLCPYFYNAAFSNNFTQNNFYLCPARRPILNLPEDFKMGYMEKRKSPDIVGEIFIPTGTSYPWTFNVTQILLI